MYKNIKILSFIPVDLIEAENVASVVILGETYEINETIRLAKIEAHNILRLGKIIFTPYTKNQLNNIIKFY